MLINYTLSHFVKERINVFIWLRKGVIKRGQVGNARPR